jgi:uncharacterized membrane protein YbhN (UPF0104 family)
VAVIAAVAYFIAWYLQRSWTTVRGYRWSVRPGWLILSLATLSVFYWLQGAAWWLLLRGFGLRSGRLEASAVWGKSILARYVPGNVFMFVGRAWLSHRRGLEVVRVSAAMVYEQALGVCGALVAVAVLLPFWRLKTGATAWSLLAIPVLVAFMHPRVFVPVADRVLRLIRRPPLESVLRFGAVLGMLWYYVATWLLVGLGGWLFGRAVLGLSAHLLAGVTVALALGYVAGMAAFFVPSGLGVREVVMAATLAGHLPGGVALAFAIALRLWQTLVELSYVGVVSLADYGGRRRSRSGG